LSLFEGRNVVKTLFRIVPEYIWTFGIVWYVFLLAINSNVAWSEVVIEEVRETELNIGGYDLENLAPGTQVPLAQQDRASLLVHFIPQLADSTLAAASRLEVRNLLRAVGGYEHHEYKLLSNVLNIRGIPARMASVLARIPGVVKVEEDYRVQASLNDSTPLIGALQSQISGAGLPGLPINGSGVRICIVDTGIDSNHVMYGGRIDTTAGYDFVNDDNNPEDDHGHGSHVAGIALGGTGLSVNFGCGSQPFQGVAPGATLIGVKVLDGSGSGLASDIIAGIDHCASSTLPGGQADVINLSLGSYLAFTGNCDTDAIAQAANNAVNKGVVVVAAAGNNAQINSTTSPACASKVIAVGATYDNDYPNTCGFPTQTSFTYCTETLFGFCVEECTDNSPSKDSLTCFSNQSDTLDVVAPGCITYSTDASNPNGNGIVGFCGTSMAAPHVAGLAALLLDATSALTPPLTPAQVRQLIRNGAMDLGPAGFDRGYGYGRIDVIKSLQLAAGGTPPPPPAPVTIASDGFESGNFSGGSGWVGAWVRSGDAGILSSEGPHSGSRHVRLRRSTGYLERAVNLLGATSVRLQFWAKVRSFESSDRAYVQVKPSGGVPSTVKTFTPADSNNQYSFYDIDLSGFNMTTDFRIIFDAAMNSTGDYWYLDDIQVIGVRQ
jgi:subtilisin family serine protease